MVIFEGTLTQHTLECSSLCLTFKTDGLGARIAGSFQKFPTTVQEGTVVVLSRKNGNSSTRKLMPPKQTASIRFAIIDTCTSVMSEKNVNHASVYPVVSTISSARVWAFTT